MLVAKNATTDFQSLDEERLGLGELTLSSVQQRQVIHGAERVGVLLAQYAAADFQHLDKELLGLGEVAKVLVHRRQAVHRDERVRMLVPQESAAEIPGALQVRLGGRKITQFEVGVADG